MYLLCIIMWYFASGNVTTQCLINHDVWCVIVGLFLMKISSPFFMFEVGVGG